MDVYKYIMEKPNVVKRLNTIIQDSTKPRVDLVGRSWTGTCLHIGTFLHTWCLYRDENESWLVRFIANRSRDGCSVWTK